MEHTILTEYVYTLMCLPLGASGADCNSTFVIKNFDQVSHSHLHDTNLLLPVDKKLIV